MKWSRVWLPARKCVLPFILCCAIGGAGSPLEARLRPSLNRPVAAAAGPPSLPTVIDATTRRPDFFGNALPAGDVNADGKDDLLQSIVEPVQTQLVRGGIYFGHENSQISTGTVVGEPDLIIRPPRSVGPGLPRFTGLRPVADLNGDGIAEIAVDVANVRAPDNRITGATYIFFGSRFLVGSIDLGDYFFNLEFLLPEAPPVGGIFSTIGDAVGDVNGDGTMDLVFRKSSFDPGADIFVVPGPFGVGFGPTDIVDLKYETRRAVITDASEVSALELADVDRDGTEDLLLVKPAASEVEILSGSAELARGRRISLRDRTPDARIANVDSNPLQVIRLTSGDVNADGIDDIVLGVPRRLRNGNFDPSFGGELYVVFGSEAFRGRTVSIAAGEHDVTVRGALGRSESNFASDELGTSVLTMDVNGDGASDIVAEAPLADGPDDEFTDSGEVYLVLASPGWTKGTVVDIGRGQQDLTLVYPARFALLRAAPGNRFDFNGDGFFDIGYLTRPVTPPRPDSISIEWSNVILGGPPAAPEIVTARFQKKFSRLIVTGLNLTAAARVEVNGVLIDREVAFVAKDNTLTIEGKKKQLNLHSGKNAVVVIARGKRSNTIRVKL